MHFVGFIDLRFLFIIIRKVPKDRKVMPEAGLIYDKFCCLGFLVVSPTSLPTLTARIIRPPPLYLRRSSVSFVPFGASGG